MTGRLTAAIRKAIAKGDPVFRTLSGKHVQGSPIITSRYSAEFPRDPRVAVERRRNKVARRQRRVNRIRGAR